MRARFGSFWPGLVGVLVGGLMVCGCAGPDQPKGNVPTIGVHRELPTYDAAARGYNSHIERLDKLWARALIRMWYTDEKGERHSDQGDDGHLQVVRGEGKLSFDIGKLGKTYFHLGCDDERYWWMDLSEERVAWVGRHANAARHRVGNSPLPIHPLDMIDLLALTLLPVSDVGTDPGRVVSSADGDLIAVIVPSRWGHRRVWLEPETYRPVYIELLDSSGKAVVFSKLGRPREVIVRGESRPWPIFSSEVLIEMPYSDTRVRLRLSDLENRKGGQKDMPFEFDRLVEVYRIQDIVDLDRLEADHADARQ